MDKKKEQFKELIEGSKYRIFSIESKEKPLTSIGYFRGYAIVGNTDGVCLELDETHAELKGKIRIIPSHMIISIDVLEEKKKDEKEERKEYFGWVKFFFPKFALP